MNCRDALDRVQEGLERELSADESAEISDHLSRCGDCRAAAVEFRRVHRRLAGQPVRPVPPGLVDAILVRTSRDAAPRLRWREAASLAAAAAILAVAFSLLFPRGLTGTATADEPPALREVLPWAEGVAGDVADAGNDLVQGGLSFTRIVTGAFDAWSILAGVSLFALAALGLNRLAGRHGGPSMIRFLPALVILGLGLLADPAVLDAQEVSHADVATTSGDGDATDQEAEQKKIQEAAEQVLLFTLVSLALLVPSAALLLLVSVVAPGLVTRAARRLNGRHLLCAAAGLPLLLILGLISYGLETIPVAGALAGTAFLVVVVAGWTAMSRDLGRRLLASPGRERHPSLEITVGLSVGLLTGLVPLFGWFLIGPYLTCAGAGSLVLALVSRDGGGDAKS